MPEISTQRLLTVQRKMQLAVGGLIAAGLFVGGYFLLQARPITLPSGTNANTAPRSNVNPTAALYTDLFDAAYRPDQGRGNVAIAAVYYFPALQRALDAFTQQSEHQQELSAALQAAKANEEALAVYLIVDSVIPQDTIDLSRGVSLRDGQGRLYPFLRWQKLLSLLPQEKSQVRTASLLFFSLVNEKGERFSKAAANELTLTIENIDKLPKREFGWSLRAFPE